MGWGGVVVVKDEGHRHIMLGNLPLIPPPSPHSDRQWPIFLTLHQPHCKSPCAGTTPCSHAPQRQRHWRDCSGGVCLRVKTFSNLLRPLFSPHPIPPSLPRLASASSATIALLEMRLRWGLSRRRKTRWLCSCVDSPAPPRASPKIAAGTAAGLSIAQKFLSREGRDCHAPPHAHIRRHTINRDLSQWQPIISDRSFLSWLVKVRTS
jgi:hypothetical protein